MKDKFEKALSGKAAAAAGAAIGSAAIAAALLFMKRRKDKNTDGEPPRTSKAPHYPPETD